MSWRVIAVGAYALVAAATVAIVRAEPDFALAGSAAWRAAELAAGGLLLLAALGAHAWRPRPAYAFPLLAAALLWPLAEWNSPGAGAGFTAGLVLSAAWAPALAHGALRGPDVRPLRRAGRAVIALGYGAAIGVLGLAAAMAFDPAAQGCLDCPRNVLLVHGDADVWRTAERAGLALTAAWAALYLILAAVTLTRSGPARRILAAPVLIPATAGVMLLGAQAVHGFDRGFLSNDPTDRALWAGAIAALALTAAGVAWERVRAWRTRQEVARIVVALGDSPPPGGLEAQLAATLGDPSLRLLHALDGERGGPPAAGDSGWWAGGDGPAGTAEPGGWVDGEGRAISLPQGREITYVVAGDRPVGALVHRAGLLADAGQAAEIAGAARLALEHERMGALRRAHLEQLRASRARLVATADAERRALERDLHDGAQQRLVTLAIGMRLAQRTIDDPELAQALAGAEEELRTALAELRELAHGLFPAVLADEGLAAAVEVLAEQEPRLRGELPQGRFEPPVEYAAYFVILEALKRAAPGAVNVAATASPGVLLLDVATTEPLDGAPAPLEDRVGALGGTVAFGPTGLRVELPCAS